MHPVKLFAAGAFAASLALPALAEKADRAKPINLEADTVTIDDANKSSIYDGNVQLSQGTLVLRATRVSVKQSDAGLESLHAVGNPVAFRQKTDAGDLIEGYADRIDYVDKSGMIDLVGHARLRRGEDELRGEQISYNAGTSTYKVVGAPNPQTPGGRVRAVIRPRPATAQP